MIKDASLAALQAIDVIVYKSSHQELSPEDLAELQSACRSLVHSVQDTPCIAKKAAWIVELIQAAFLESSSRASALWEEIHECGISLSLFIQRQPESELGTDERAGREGQSL